MSDEFSYKTSIYFSNLNNDNINFKDVLNNKFIISSNSLYKVDVIKHKKIENIGNYEINVENNGIISSEFNYPESGYIINLPQRNLWNII